MRTIVLVIQRNLGPMTAVALLSMGGCAATAPAPATPVTTQSQCVFDRYVPTSVSPFSGTDVSSDWGSYHHVSGAQLFVPAQEGLSKEWLQVEAQRALTSAQDASEDATPVCDIPRLKNTHANVVPAPNGYWVQVMGVEDETGDALLKWAEARVSPPAAKE